jgi:PEGA domain
VSVMKRCAVILLLVLLMHATWVQAATKNELPLTIKVLSANTETIPLNTQDNDVPKDCNIMDFSAYCHHSRTAIVRHTMLVQDNNSKSYTISCTVDSIWSKCVSLPVGTTLNAQWAKHGITIWYPNTKGGESKQTYSIVSPESQTSRNAPSATSTQVAPSAASGKDASVSATAAEKVKCNFTSTPSGAEIMLDGKYVGNTPSIIALDPGTHVVGMGLPGFAKWKRELTVLSGSDISVSAELEKTHH